MAETGSYQGTSPRRHATRDLALDGHPGQLEVGISDPLHLGLVVETQTAQERTQGTRRTLAEGLVAEEPPDPRPLGLVRQEPRQATQAASANLHTDGRIRDEIAVPVCTR